MNRQLTYSVSEGTRLVFTYRWNYTFNTWEQINHEHGTKAIADEAVVAQSLEMLKEHFAVRQTLCAWCPHPKEVRDGWSGALTISHGLCECCLKTISDETKGLVLAEESVSAQH